MPLNKIPEVTLYAIASTAANTTAVGSTIDVSTYYGCDVRIRMGRISGTVFTNPPSLRVEAAYKSSPSANEWIVIQIFQPSLGTAIGAQAVSGTSNAGDSTLTLAAGTNFAAHDYVFVQNSTLANSEWKKVLSVSGAVLTLQEPLVFAQTGSTARNQAEEYHLSVDLTSILRLRLAVDTSMPSGVGLVIESGMGAVAGL